MTCGDCAHYHLFPNHDFGYCAMDLPAWVKTIAAYSRSHCRADDTQAKDCRCFEEIDEMPEVQETGDGASVTK